MTVALYIDFLSQKKRHLIVHDDVLFDSDVPPNLLLFFICHYNYICVVYVNTINNTNYLYHTDFHLKQTN